MIYEKYGKERGGRASRPRLWKYLSVCFTLFALALFCVCFSACDLFGAGSALGGEKNLSGSYRLVSFTTADKTYKIGDDYNGEALTEASVKLSLEEYKGGFVDADGKEVTVRKFNLTFSIDGGHGSFGFYTRKGNSLTMPSYVEDDYTCYAKVSGNKITLTLPDGNDIKSVVLMKS